MIEKPMATNPGKRGLEGDGRRPLGAMTADHRSAKFLGAKPGLKTIALGLGKGVGRAGIFAGLGAVLRGRVVDRPRQQVSLRPGGSGVLAQNGGYPGHFRRWRFGETFPWRAFRGVRGGWVCVRSGPLAVVTVAHGWPVRRLVARPIAVTPFARLLGWGGRNERTSGLTRFGGSGKTRPCDPDRDCNPSRAWGCFFEISAYRDFRSCPSRAANTPYAVLAIGRAGRGQPWPRGAADDGFRGRHACAVRIYIALKRTWQIGAGRWCGGRCHACPAATLGLGCGRANNYDSKARARQGRGGAACVKDRGQRAVRARG